MELFSVEEALRRINPRVALAYWDSTFEFDMENPVNTILFSPPFLGNGDGFVNTGPFANWQLPNLEPLTRNIGMGSRLLSKEIINTILTRCRTIEISDRTAQDQFNLELAHGGPHLWVGGHLAGLNTAAHDPVFFLHHAFIDYIWELFRIRQFQFCGVNPEMDYPPAPGLHAPNRPMDGLPGYRNIDGYRNYWTRFWYRYEASPTCSRWNPYCGTPYLRCDMMRGRCVSVARMLAPDEGVPMPGGAAGYSAAATSNSPRANRARMQAASINVGPTFRAPPSEPRTQAAQLAMAGRFRRAAPQSESTASTEAFTAPASDGRTSDAYGYNIASGILGGSDPVIDPRMNGHIFPESTPLRLLPTPDAGMDTMVNISQFQTPTDKSLSSWIYAPVDVYYHSRIETHQNDRCVYEQNSAHVKVQSQGLNYIGAYTDYLIFDATKPVSRETAFVAMRIPEIGPSEAALTAAHSCGYMCVPMCRKTGQEATSYTRCHGIITITPDEVKNYATSYNDAKWLREKGGETDIAFHCSPHNMVPWFNGNTTSTPAF